VVTTDDAQTAEDGEARDADLELPNSLDGQCDQGNDVARPLVDGIGSGVVPHDDLGEGIPTTNMDTRMVIGRSC
jgi:hypothetical protein